MRAMQGRNVAWLIAALVVAVALNPMLKAIGLLPRDVFMQLGIFYPGLPQLVFGPLIAVLSLVCFLKTREVSVFPIIGIVRALSLSIAFPANIEHSGTGLAGILAGFIAAYIVNRGQAADFRSLVPKLAGLYAALYAAGNYATTLMFGPAAQTKIIVSTPHLAGGVVLGALVLGVLLGALTCRLMPQGTSELSGVSG